MAKPRPGGRCPHCGIFKHELTSDHIIPREKGGFRKMYGDTNNIRMVCAKCNSVRAACLHCHVPLMLAFGVAKDAGTGPRVVLRAWEIIL